MGASGEALKRELKILSPEIYGCINDPERVELDGLLYVMDRLPKGIEECQFIKLIAKEGFEQSNFDPVIAPKRRRNSYRIDHDQFFIEMTRGRSDIYDILTHLTFMYIESEKIRRNATDSSGTETQDWKKLENVVCSSENDSAKEQAYTYLSIILGRTYEETKNAVKAFAGADEEKDLFHLIYWLGKRSIDEFNEEKDRQITFSTALRERIGHHIYGEIWAENIKEKLNELGLINRPIHIISANMHSVLNTFFALDAVGKEAKTKDFEELVEVLSSKKGEKYMPLISKWASKHGMVQIEDNSGMNISVQLFDTKKIQHEFFKESKEEKPVLIVMDYAFGEQAYETLDELLKPFDQENEKIPLDIRSISIMGKAGIMEGKKGDIIIPTSFVFEGTADNYPINNLMLNEDLDKIDIPVFTGSMITVLGTSLQNKDILRYFNKSSWSAVGLEMEGAHYQKAIQAASKIRNNISEEVQLRYAYYASDNPLVTGHTLASGSLGVEGVKPTYEITRLILLGIARDHL